MHVSMIYVVVYVPIVVVLFVIAIYNTYTIEMFALNHLLCGCTKKPHRDVYLGMCINPVNTKINTMYSYESLLRNVRKIRLCNNWS